MPNPQDHGEKYNIMEKIRTPDGMGGYTYQWSPGVEFKGTPSLDSSIDAIVAAKTMEYIQLHMQVDTSIPLELNDYIKRQSDGETYIVKSDPNANKTPIDAGLSFKEFDIVKAPLPMA